MSNQGAVVVTGASSGIGRVCALRLERLGFRVFAGVRKAEDGEALMQQASDRLSYVTLDVTDESSVAAATGVVEAATDGRGLWGLVNNAGIVLACPLEFVPIPELRKQLEVNVIGQIAVTQAFLPMLRRGRGRVVNVGSISGRLAFPLLGPYCASKFALEALTASLRMELRPWGIPVSIIEPGGIATPIWSKALASGDELVRRLPPRAQDLYGPIAAAQRERAVNSGRSGLPPEAVARQVAHALTAGRPKTRYIVGRSALLGEILRLAPEQFREWLIANAAARSPAGRL
jgi:NAD(P)-dependent dehydrogenase (short-subunit alcohol dehydrogenase family)